MKKILVDGMPRTIGGIGVLILNLAECSRECGDSDSFQFEFIIAGTSGYLTTLREKGYKYHIAPPIHDLVTYNSFLSKLFAENDYDYLWFNNTSKVNIMLPVFAKKNGLKIITHPHGVKNEEKGLKLLLFRTFNKLHERKMLSLVDIPFACSREAADIYYGDTALRERVLIMHNGINVDTFSFNQTSRNLFRDKLGLEESDILLGTVGRLTAVKNYPFIINVLSRLKDEYKLIIIGDGEEKDTLQNMIIDKNLSNRCFLLGSKKNVADYLSAMDCFLLPSFNEGMPFSIVEAQCEGLPCIVSDTLTREVAITDLVNYASINDENEWTRMITALKRDNKRCIYREKIIQAGYSIEQSYLMFKQACESCS